MSAARPCYTLAQLANHLGAELHGPADALIRGVGSLANAAPDEVTFLVDSARAVGLAGSQAGAIMLKADAAGNTDRPVLIVASPYLAYARVSQLFDRTPAPEPGIHPSAVVHPEAQVAPGASIGANSVIERGAVIGDGAAVGPGSVVGARSVLGRCTRLYANVTLYHDVILGEHCLIHSGAVIGADGFGFAPDQGRWERIAQNGGVIIGDWVSIGANTTIDRGAIDDTVIEDSVIIDNLCQIAHNVRIGRASGLAAKVGIAGSTVIGAHCTLAGAVGVTGHIVIADGVHLSGGTVVTKSIREPGSWSSGTPMMPTAKWRRAAARYAQLDELARRVQQLEKQSRKPS